MKRERTTEDALFFGNRKCFRTSWQLATPKNVNLISTLLILFINIVMKWFIRIETMVRLKNSIVKEREREMDPHKSYHNERIQLSKNERNSKRMLFFVSLCNIMYLRSWEWVKSRHSSTTFKFLVLIHGRCWHLVHVVYGFVTRLTKIWRASIEQYPTNLVPN